MEKELIFWLVLMVVLLVIELITVGLTCIWFAGGALAAVIVSVAGGPIWITGSGIFSCFPVDAVLYQTVGDEIYPAKEGKDELRRGTGEGCAGHRACRQSQRYRKSNV